MRVEKGKVRAPEIGTEFGALELKLRCSAGIAGLAFTFTSCVDPLASVLQSATVTQS